MQFKQQRWKDAQSWEVRQGSDKHVVAYENQIQAFFLPKELHKVSVSKVIETTFFFLNPKKVMDLGLGKQTQHGENLTKRKQGWIMIQFLSDYLDIKLQTHLRKQEVMQTQNLHSENTTVIPEHLRGKIT